MPDDDAIKAAPPPTWSGDEPSAAPVTPAVPPAQASPAPPAAPAGGRTAADRIRSIAIGLAFFLACLGLVVTTTGWWVNRTFTNTESFVSLTAPIVDDPAVQEALAQATADRVAEALDLGDIGRYVAVGIARELYASDAFAQLWETAMRSVHGVLIAVLRDEADVLQLVDDQVVINLYPFIDRILDRFSNLDLAIQGRPIELPALSDPSDPVRSRAELEAFLGRPLPPTFGTIPVARGDRLVAAQQAFAVFQLSIVILAVVTLLLAVVAVVLARRRIRMIALLGVGGLASLLVARLAISALEDAVADALSGGGDAAVIGREIVAALTDSYRDLTEAALFMALLAAVVATVVAWALQRQASAAGPGAPEAAIADRWFLAIAGLCIALAVLILVGLTLGSFALVTLGYIAWLVVAWRTGRRAEGAAAG